MIDDRKNDEDQAPNGMVRKTRRVRKKRRSPDTKSEKDADSLFARAKELLIGMHDEDEDYGPVDVAEQVRRLKKRKLDDKKPLDDVWGTKKRSVSWVWIVIIGIIVPVVAIIIGITKLTGGGDYDPGLVNKDDLVDVQEITFDAGEGPLGWYQAS